MLKFIDKNLINKSLYNINILIKNNKNEQTVKNIKNYLQTFDKITYSEYYYINKKIDKIYLSHSIKEGFDLLKQNNICIQNYEKLYIENYNNNIQLYYLFKSIEYRIIQEIKNNNIQRNKFILLPFYYNIYLKKMK